MPRRSRISIDLLETLTTLMEAEGDAAKAMELLGINQPSMSKRLAMLQHAHPAIPHPWLTRDGKKWTLTPDGKRYHPAAREIVYRQRMLENAILGNKGPANRVWLCCGEEAVRSFVRPAVEEFRAKFPNTSFCISVLSPSERIAAVATGAADMATVTHDDDDIRSLAGRPLHIEELTTDPLVVVAGKNASPALKRSFGALPQAQVKLSQLKGMPLILPAAGGGTRNRIDEALAKYALHDVLEIIAELEGWQTMLEYVQCGLGVAILPESAARLNHDQLLAPKHIDNDDLLPTVTKLICRFEAKSATKLALEGEAEELRKILQQRARKRSR